MCYDKTVAGPNNPVIKNLRGTMCHRLFSIDHLPHVRHSVSFSHDRSGIQNPVHTRKCLSNKTHPQLLDTFRCYLGFKHNNILS